MGKGERREMDGFDSHPCRKKRVKDGARGFVAGEKKQVLRLATLGQDDINWRRE